MPKKKIEVKTVPLQIRLPEAMLEGIDRAVEIGQGSSRAEIIRMAIANYLKELSITQEMKKRKPKI